MEHIKKFFSFALERARFYFAELLVWLQTAVPRWRPILGTFVFLLLTEILLLYGGSRIFAATYTFVQTSWAGGSSVTTAAHPGDQSSWTKYSASTDADTGTAGQVTLSTVSGSFSETFNTTTYKDAANTSVTWDTSGTLTTSSSPNDPVANWKFNESSGTSAADFSGNSITGTLTNFTCTTSVDCNADSSWSATGKYNNSLHFKGEAYYDDDHLMNTVATAHNASLDNLSALTVMGWFKRDAQGSLVQMLGKHDATSGDYNGENTGWSLMEPTANGYYDEALAFLVDYSGNNLKARSDWNVFPDNTWTHIAVTWDGTTNLTGVKFYVNGSLVGHDTANEEGNATGSRDSDAAYGFTMGAYTESADDSYDGRMDDVRIYNRVLSAAEILSASAGEIASMGNVAQSLTVDNVSSNIVSATMTASASGSVTYYMSNDGGSHWQAATLSTPLTFSQSGSDLRFKLSLASGATVSDLSIAYSGITSGSLTSSAYDSGDSANLVTKIAWTASAESGTDRVKFQIRTSADGNTWSGWCGYSDTGSTCDGSNYFVTANNDSSVGSSNPIRSGGNDRWFQYKISLTATSGASAATINDVTVTYVVNATPEFNSSNGLVVSQISDSASANWGKVSIAYSIRDSDTSTGTANPGYVTPTFQYNIGSGWVNITSGYLNSGATDNKAVGVSSYTDYTAYWDAQTQIPATYYATAQVRVTINDNEAANNTVTSTSSTFVVDTKVPAISAFKINSVTDALTVTSADDSILQYRISNNADLSADGANATSGAWQSPVANSISLTPSWTLTGAPSYESAYLQVRDALGNVSSATAVAPSTQGNMYIQDISNVPAESYKEFISWDVFVPTSGSAFSKYQVYRSTDASSYSQVGGDITDVATNYYADQAASADTTYYYKVRVVDTDTDIGNYSSVVSDTADGQGGSDTTAPAITSVTVSEEQATYATITWTTDELSNSEVDYSVSPSTAFGTHVSVESYVTSHSVTITGLNPSATYLFRVKSADVIGNEATEDNDGDGFSINTAGGPVISNVTETTVDEHIATIFWNTDIDSDSHVSYSTHSDLSSPTRLGSNSLVGGPPYQHKVTLTGLSPGTKYYYFVESTDDDDNDSKDTNGNNYYSFVTTSDTKAPVISDVSVPVSGLTAAVVVWSTDEDATGIVDYGTVSGTYPDSTDPDETLSVFHIGALSDLTENTTYYYRVRSEDNAGNEATSDEESFDTDETHTVTVTVGGGGGGGGSTRDTTAPTISNIQTKDIKSFNATVSFSTSEDTIGFVSYGVDPANLNQTSGDSTFSVSHAIKLTGLIMGKKYTFVVRAIDTSGNVTTSQPQTLTTTFFTESTIQFQDAEAFQKELEEAIESALPSLVPPFIERPQVLEITDNSAKVTWRTNVKAYGSVAYADESVYDATKENPYASEATDTTTKSVEHKIDLANLKPNTRYHVMVRSFSLPEVVGKSSDLTFVTEALKINATVGNITNKSFRAIWNTTEPTTSVVEYRNLKTGELSQKTSESKTLTHDVLVDNLTPGSSYTVNVFGYNDKGNKVSIASAVKITTSIDMTAPVITSLTINSAIIPGRANSTQTIVSWKTDEPSTSTVFFKEGVSLPGEKLTNKVEITNSLVVDHSVVVSSLKAGGLYSIQVASTDDAGNQTLFPIRTAVIPEQSQSVVEIIFKNFEDTFQFLK